MAALIIVVMRVVVVKAVVIICLLSVLCYLCLIKQAYIQYCVALICGHVATVCMSKLLHNAFLLTGTGNSGLPGLTLTLEVGDMGKFLHFLLLLNDKRLG